mgnify:CR=1 FL=1
MNKAKYKPSLHRTKEENEAGERMFNRGQAALEAKKQSIAARKEWERVIRSSASRRGYRQLPFDKRCEMVESESKPDLDPEYRRVRYAVELLENPKPPTPELSERSPEEVKRDCLHAILEMRGLNKQIRC